MQPFLASIQKLLLPVLSILIIFPTLSPAWEGKVVGVSDGDTITVMQGEKVRRYKVDSPEKHQDLGQKAKSLLSIWHSGKL